MDPRTGAHAVWGLIRQGSDMSSQEHEDPYGWLSIWSLLGTPNIRCRIMIGIQKGTIILTTTHILVVKSAASNLAFDPTRWARI